MNSPQQPAQNPQLQQKEVLAAVNLLSAINKFNLKVFSTKTRKGLIFLILNDTAQIVRYERAVLWSFEDDTPKMLGVSGQSTINTNSDLAIKWASLVKDIKEPEKAQILSQNSFNSQKTLWTEISETNPNPSVLWVPIFCQQKLTLGMWVEHWNNVSWSNQEVEIFNFVVQAFGIAWEKFLRKLSYKFLKRRRFIIAATIATLLILSFRVSLRVVAPCEVVPKDPVVITAPLEDIIANIMVKPGQRVKKGDILFEYDKRVAEENLKAAQEQVQIAQQDLNRANTLAFRDEKSLAEISVLTAKLKKEQVNLELAEYRSSQLIDKAPESGEVMLEDPEAQHGKPVHVGEKIMMISDPNKTKIKIWIPESDNVVLDPTKTLKVILDTDPTAGKRAKLLYIANASTVNDKHVPSFVAEAEWINDDGKNAKMGVKGTAILYGENVSIFYWILRKPWAYFRNLIGE